MHVDEYQRGLELPGMWDESDFLGGAPDVVRGPGHLGAQTAVEELTERVEAKSAPLADLAGRIAKINRDNGWFDSERSFGDDIALLHSEVSEAYEEYRAGRDPSRTYYSYGDWGLDNSPTIQLFDDSDSILNGKPEGVPSELADVLIRVLDTAYRYGIDLDDVIEEKLAFNATRGYRHGGKVV